MVEGGKELPLQRFLSSGMHVEKETIVEETAIQLRAINSDNEEYTHATLLATPSNLIELHAGHLFFRRINSFTTNSLRFQTFT